MKWKKRGLIFDPSDMAHSKFTHAQCPTALVQEESIRIYFGSRNQNWEGRIFYIEVDKLNPQNILYVHDKSILEGGSSGAFDQNGILQVCVSKFGQDLYLYYGGFSKMITCPHTCMMGVAISKNGGKSFNRLYEGPILPISKTDPFLIGSADILFHEKKWHMIYTSGTSWFRIENNFELAYTLKYADSFDGINWNPSGVIVIPQDTQLSADCKPSIFKLEDTFHMVFSTRKINNYRVKGANAYKFGYAISKDLKKWDRCDDNVGIEASAKGWDSEMICYPNIVKIDNKYLMFYNGNGFGKSGFGYAELEI